MKNSKLKARVIIACIIITSNIVFAQQDSLKNIDSLKTSNFLIIDTAYEVEDCTYNYLEPEKTNDNITGNEIINYKYKSFESISNIIFKQNNKLSLFNIYGDSLSVNLKYAKDFKIKTGTYFGEGILIGIPTVISIEMLIWHKTFEKGDGFEWFFGTILTLFSGTVFGGGIGSFLKKEETINLDKIDEMNRVNKLKNFINNNR